MKTRWMSFSVMELFSILHVSMVASQMRYCTGIEYKAVSLGDLDKGYLIVLCIVSYNYMWNCNYPTDFSWGYCSVGGVFILYTKGFGFDSPALPYLPIWVCGHSCHRGGAGSTGVWAYPWPQTAPNHQSKARPYLKTTTDISVSILMMIKQYQSCF